MVSETRSEHGQREGQSVMRRIIGVAVIALLLVAGLSVFSSANASSSNGETIELTSTLVDSADIDLGEEGFSLGDEFVFTDDLYEDDELVGTDHGVCTVTRIDEPEATLHCVATFVLDDRGQITAQGAITFEESEGNPSFTVAITGGTDEFSDATGEVEITETSAEESELVFMLG
jgi:hypothetical protein